MITGVINVRKERGMTSFGVVAAMRRIFEQKKIGHTGTLDPDAEGVLPVCFGRATRLVETLMRGTKTYRCVMLLGVTTDTQDTTGTVLETRPVNVTEDQVRDALLSFAGKQMQMPPMYSAVKVGGKKLVDLARRGIEVEREMREVEFSEFIIHEMSLPRVTFSVTCSHGAYIRTLCHDTGEKLGCGAAMESLLRTRVGEFRLEDALTIDEIRALKEKEDAADGARGGGETAGPYSFVIPPDHFYGELPAVHLAGANLSKIISGNPVPKRKTDARDLHISGCAKLYTEDGRFIGIYRYDEGRFFLEKYYFEDQT